MLGTAQMLRMSKEIRAEWVAEVAPATQAAPNYIILKYPKTLNPMASDLIAMASNHPTQLVPLSLCFAFWSQMSSCMPPWKIRPGITWIS